MKGNRVFDPQVDRGFTPSRSIDTDFHLARKCALSDLAVKGRAAQARAVEDRLEAEDAVRVHVHGGVSDSLIAGTLWGGAGEGWTP